MTEDPRPCARYALSDGTLCSTHNGRYASVRESRCDRWTEDPRPSEAPMTTEPAPEPPREPVHTHDYGAAQIPCANPRCRPPSSVTPDPDDLSFRMNREALATAIDRADGLPAIALDTRIARWFLAVVERVYEGPSSVTPDLRAPGDVDGLTDDIAAMLHYRASLPKPDRHERTRAGSGGSQTCFACAESAKQAVEFVKVFALGGYPLASVTPSEPTPPKTGWKFDAQCEVTVEDHEMGAACHPLLPHSHRSGSIKWARPFPPSEPTPGGECGYDDPHEPHEYVVAQGDRPVTLACPGVTPSGLTQPTLDDSLQPEVS